MGKSLIIAEKPSVAKEITEALGGFSRQGDYYERDDAIVSSAIGHLVELACPENEDPGYDLARLPAIPSRFNLAPLPRTSSQLTLLKKLMARPDVHTVVNACDAGREGELIFRYIYLFCGCRKDMRRMWLQSMTHQSIRAAHAAMRPGRDFDALFTAAQSRSEADWLVGINGTRAASILKTMQSGERAKSTVGRVQTPTLHLIVEREEAIRRFVPKPYFEVQALFGVRAGEYGAKWIDPKFKADALNPDARAERLFDKAAADAIVRKCQGRTPSSVSDTSTEVLSGPPKLFDLTTLQREANKQFGFSASATLGLAQALYEKHKVLTYPRTDSNALPEDYVDTARATLATLGHAGLPISPFAARAVNLVKPDKRIFNNAKISDHFAIIPTGVVSGVLSGDETKIYDLVARRFIAAFFPSAKYLQTVRITLLEGETFKSSGRVLVEQGWLAVYGQDVNDKDDPALCQVAKGELPATRDLTVAALKTKPPLRFTEATLLGAMESAGAAIEDEELREAMKERGLGTPATRAAIIEKLLDPKVAYIARDKKNLVPTANGFELIGFLRANNLMALASAQTTGEWEFKLRQMEQGKYGRREFMAEIALLARDIVDRVRANAKNLPAAQPRQAMAARCPKCAGQMASDRKTFSCGGCGFKVWREIAGRLLSDDEGERLIAEGIHPTLPGFVSKAKKRFSAGLKLSLDLSGKVEFVFEEPAQASYSGVACPQCGKPMGRRPDGKGGHFWSCTGYPECRSTMDDKDGRPVPKQPGGIGSKRSSSASGQACPTCKAGKLIGRQTGEGKPFLGCTKYPACRHFEWVRA